MNDFEDDDWTDEWWDEEPYLDGFTDWPELTEELVHQDWLEISAAALRLFRQDRCLIVLELPPLNARMRRALHRAGFRRTPGAALMQWRWAAETATLPTEPRERFRVAIQDAMNSRLAVAQKATQVAREVMQAEPIDVGIALATERFRELERQTYGR